MILSSFFFCKADGNKKSQEFHLSTYIWHVSQNIPPEKSWILDIYLVMKLLY